MASDSAKLPSAQNLGAECLRQIQDLQIAHWGTENLRILQEDTIQTLLMGANRLLDFSLSMEKTIIDLRQSALRTYNIALGGQACGKLLDLLENIFGYPETWASKDFEAALWPYSLLDPEHEPEVEKAADSNQAGTSREGVPEVSGNRGYHCSLKRQASASFETPTGKGKAFRKPSSVPIQEATAFLVISEKAITMTGISGSDLLIGKATKKAGSKESRGKQSIYRCQHCRYISEQKPKELPMYAQNTRVIASSVGYVIIGHFALWTLSHISSTSIQGVPVNGSNPCLTYPTLWPLKLNPRTLS